MKINIQKYAAIDIGSNAVRLLIANVITSDSKPPMFKKNSLVRVPIRLGKDVFDQGKISATNSARLSDAIQAFKLLIKTHGVDKYKACATSAMREADNGMEISDKIYDETGIRIELIDGNEEAKIIASTDISEYIDESKTYLYVDVGGGSTEFSVFHRAKKVSARSFKIGTVRMLNDSVKPSTWRDARNWIIEESSKYDQIIVIGSGGNINKIFKMSGKEMGKPLTYFYLSSLYHNLGKLSYEERIVELNLNQDRADVIIPATRIYLSAMKWSKAKHIYVPKIGLSDGIIKSLYFNKIEGSSL